MSVCMPSRAAGLGSGQGRYVRHCPEQTLLYQLVERRYPRFLAELAARGQALPAYIEREFEDYLKCGRLE